MMRYRSRNIVMICFCLRFCFATTLMWCNSDDVDVDKRIEDFRFNRRRQLPFVRSHLCSLVIYYLIFIYISVILIITYLSRLIYKLCFPRLMPCNNKSKTFYDYENKCQQKHFSICNRSDTTPDLRVRFTDR